MDKQQALDLLRRRLSPEELSAFLMFWWEQGLTNGPQVQASEHLSVTRLAIHSADGDLLEDCKWCGGSHTAGTADRCPLNPNRKQKPADDPASGYLALEAALQLLTGQILHLRTELLVIKALVAKDGDQEAQ